ncbi:hypothetical protein CXG81DRAFT_19871 [Caulochytrium protostelioides]|uniref:Uncharacterized protein n=1 Tax=Caulochytrium protostelioides TaxID=1555241 RepID=A0A4P9X510_9FUNG|nr:hypothetical protein CXG81DRAFT_19871 [Caulochytrium protostelioides]|eukprot:RKP00141.1 hypothetical protein CXG81DRAFT_19871 [Caulochytrium protostelioides]
MATMMAFSVQGFSRPPLHTCASAETSVAVADVAATTTTTAATSSAPSAAASLQTPIPRAPPSQLGKAAAATAVPLGLCRPFSVGAAFSQRALPLPKPAVLKLTTTAATAKTAAPATATRRRVSVSAGRATMSSTTAPRLVSTRPAAPRLSATTRRPTTTTRGLAAAPRSVSGMSTLSSAPSVPASSRSDDASASGGSAAGTPSPHPGKRIVSTSSTSSVRRPLQASGSVAAAAGTASVASATGATPTPRRPSTATTAASRATRSSSSTSDTAPATVKIPLSAGLPKRRLTPRSSRTASPRTSRPTTPRTRRAAKRASAAATPSAPASPHPAPVAATVLTSPSIARDDVSSLSSLHSDEFARFAPAMATAHAAPAAEPAAVPALGHDRSAAPPATATPDSPRSDASPSPLMSPSSRTDGLGLTHRRPASRPASSASRRSRPTKHDALPRSASPPPPPAVEAPTNLAAPLSRTTPEITRSTSKPATRSSKSRAGTTSPARPPPPPTLPPPADDTERPVTPVKVEGQLARILDFLQTIEDRPSGAGGAPTILTSDAFDDHRSVAPHDHHGYTRSLATGGGPRHGGMDLPAEFVPNGDLLHELKSEMAAQRLELQEKSRLIVAMRQQVKHLRSQLSTQVKQAAQDSKSQLTLQRKEYEVVVKRHLSFIDQVMKEKNELTQRYDGVVSEIDALRTQFTKKTASMTEAHARDMRHLREQLARDDKLKRDKWIAERVAAIKDQTVKGLEPEIQAMLTRHKTQLREQEERLRAEFAQQRQQLEDAHQLALDGARTRAQYERTQAVEEERALARDKIEKQAQRDAMAYETQKQQLIRHLADERHAMADGMARERQALQEENARSRADLEAQLSRALDSAEREREVAASRHAASIRQIREEAALERDQWQVSFMRDQEARIASREQALKEALVKERDAELELVVQRLESEGGALAGSVTQAHRMELERLRTEHAETVRSLRDQHNSGLARVLQLQSQLAEMETAVRDGKKAMLLLQGQLEARDVAAVRHQAELARLSMGEDVLRERIEASFKDQLVRRDQQIAALEAQLATLDQSMQYDRGQYAKKVEQKEREKAKALELVERQVRHALKTKDDEVMQAKKMADEAQRRAHQMEQLLEKQRQEFLMC